MNVLEFAAAGARPWVRVGEVYEITRRPRGPNKAGRESAPFIPMKSIPAGGAFSADFAIEDTAQSRSGTYFERGDILVAKITPSFENGKQALMLDLPTDYGWATTEVIPLRPKTDSHDRRFLFFYLLHPDIRHHIAERMEGTTARQRIPDTVLLDLPVPDFDYRDQCVVSDALESVQSAMGIESRLVSRLLDLRTTAMNTLFTYGLHGEPTRETGIGRLPQAWSVSPLLSLCQATDVVDFRKECDRAICYVDVSAIDRQYHTIAQSVEVVLRDAPSRARKRIRAEDVLFATVRPTLLRVARVPPAFDDQVCSTAFCVLRGNPEVTVPGYLFHVVRRDQFVERLGWAETGASYPAVTDRIVKQQPVPVPPLKEQREIVAILDAIDRKIEVHRRKRALLEQLFRTLLHDLMTGRIRADDLELQAAAAGPEQDSGE